MSQFVQPSESSNLGVRHFEPIPRTPFHLNQGVVGFPDVSHLRDKVKSNVPKVNGKGTPLGTQIPMSVSHKGLNSPVSVSVTWGLLEEEGKQIKPVCSEGARRFWALSSLTVQKG